MKDKKSKKLNFYKPENKVSQLESNLKFTEPLPEHYNGIKTWIEPVKDSDLLKAGAGSIISQG
jgi:hypothetical protein